MPVNAWNWYRSVSTGTDHKAWSGDNPQIEDGRDGGNVGFDDENRGQYEVGEREDRTKAEEIMWRTNVNT